MKRTVIVATIAIFAWLVFLMYETTNMMPPILRGYPGDAFFPRLVLIFALICAASILLKAALVPRGAQLAASEESTFGLHWVEFGGVCVLVLAYGLLLEPVGFEITTFAMFMILLAPRIAAGGHGPARTLAYTLAVALPTTIIMYVSFGLLLRIPLPLLFMPRHIQY